MAAGEERGSQPTPDSPVMPEESAEAAPTNQAACPSLAARVEGWVQYCEYFHLLDADMQRTSEVSAERYSSTMAGEGECRVRATEHEKCFDEIANKCLGRDRPLVRIEGESEGSEGVLILEDGTGTSAGRRVLREADLAMVRSKLRAAAHSSNLRMAAEEQQMDGLKPEPSIDLDVASLSKKRSKDVSPSDPSTCAAAIETLLWFGLALGENSSRSNFDGKSRGRSAVSAPTNEATATLTDFNLECEQAIYETGLTDEASADEVIAAVQAAEQRMVVKAVEAMSPLEELELIEACSMPLDGSESAPDAPGSFGDLANLDASSLQRFVSSSTASTLDLPCPSEIDDDMVPDPSELDAFTDPEALLDNSSRKTASPLISPIESTPERKNRRSGRAHRGQHDGQGDALESSIGKWEIKSRDKAPSSRKRRATAVSYAPLSRQQLGDDACSDSGSEAGSSTASHLTACIDSAELRMSDIGGGALDTAYSSPKRRLVSC